MEASPEKFQAIFSDKENHSLIVANTTIKATPFVKLLGVEIDNTLSFNKHISTICKKASKQLNVLKRLAFNLDSDSKLCIYRSFIMSNFNYCPVIWHCCGSLNTKKVEKIQHRALKFVFNDDESEYTTLMARAGLPSLSLARLRFIAVQIYKIIHSLSPSYLSSVITIKTSGYYLRNSNSLQRNVVRTAKYGLSSFKHLAANIWDSIPTSIKESTDLYNFKGNLKLWYGHSCTWHICRAHNILHV